MKKILLLLGMLIAATPLATVSLHAAPDPSASASPAVSGSQADPVPSAAEAAKIAALKKAFSELRPQHGEIVLGKTPGKPKGLATLNIPEDLEYLDAKDARTIVVDLWGNPPSGAQNLQGMIIPSTRSLFKEGGWGVVLTYSDDGHIDDSDAQKIDYSEMLKQIKEGCAAANKEREKNGYASVNILNWAEPPHYDPATHKIYWAKEIAFGNAPEHTLNYCIRILGRSGVLELNAVAPMSSLPDIRENSSKIISLVEFNPGSRYADYDHKTDRLATYGLAALVAGGIATKMGFFKLLLVGLLAAKKFVIVGIAAASASIRKFFKGKAKSENDTRLS